MIHQNIFMRNILDEVMRIMVKMEVCDQPSVQCDCDARKPMSKLKVDQRVSGSGLQLTDSICSMKSRHSDALKKGEASQPS